MDIPLAVVLANSLLIIVGWTRSCPRVYIVGQIFSGVGGSLYFAGPTGPLICAAALGAVMAPEIKKQLSKKIND